MQAIIDSFTWLFGEIGSFFQELIVNGPGAIMNLIYGVLPLSPFRPYLNSLGDLPYLGYLNWFFPIGEAITITFAWLTAISLYYTYMAVLRWLKVIGG